MRGDFSQMNLTKTLLILLLTITIMLMLLTPYPIEVKGQERHKFVWSRNLGKEVWGVCWSPDGEKLVATGNFMEIIVFDKSGEILWEVEASKSTYFPSISPDGKFLAVNIGSLKIYIFNIETEEQVYQTGIGIALGPKSWSPDGKFLAVGCMYGALCLFEWNGEKLTEKWAKTISEYHGDINSVCFHPSKNLIVAGSSDHLVYLVDLEGNIIWSKKLDEEVNDVCFSPKGEYIVAVTTAGTLYVLKTENGKIIDKHETTITALTNVIWSEDHIIVGDYRGYIYIYKWIKDEEKLKPTYWFRATEGNIFIAHGISYNPKYGYLAIASTDNCVYVYNISSIIKATTPTVTTTITTTTTKTVSTTLTLTKTTTLKYTITTTATTTRIYTITTVRESTKTIVETVTIPKRTTITMWKTETKTIPYTTTITKKETVTTQSIVTTTVEVTVRPSTETILLIAVAIIGIGLIIAILIKRR